VSPAARPDPSVRVATPHDLRAISETLTRAFRDDPVWNWLVTSPGAWKRGMPFVFRQGTRERLHQGTVWVTPDLTAVAVCGAPDLEHQQWRDLPAIPRSLTVFRQRSIAGLRFQSAMRAERPKEPHWYLGILGTDPDHQGQGLGSAVLAPMLERCDRDGILAYLESSKEANIPFYERHGFTVEKELRPVDGAPPIWPMARPPRPPE
jgi:GNAT superfamily N-acetyltransferase